MNPGEVMPGMEGGGMSGAMRQRSMNWLPLVVVLVVAGLWYMQVNAMGAKVTGEYQAVFLTNNQVYFGKATDLSKQYVKLSDVYYLQLQQQPVQPAPRPGALQQPAQPTQPSFTLLKLGQEIHGPLQEMWINRDQILLIEGLRDDSKVVKAIADAKEKEAADEEAAAEKEEPVKKPAAKKTTK